MSEMMKQERRRTTGSGGNNNNNSSYATKGKNKSNTHADADICLIIRSYSPCLFGT
jgi:hypothetical protein